jgi:hypothetical protein
VILKGKWEHIQTLIAEQIILYIPLLNFSLETPWA